MQGNVSSAHVNIITADNATWEDAFQFGTAGDTSWSFVGQNFRLDIKGNKEQTVPLISLTSISGQIVVDDPINRVLNMLVDEVTLNDSLVPGEYFYDLIMYDGSTPPIRVPLMHGTFKFVIGITGG